MSNRERDVVLAALFVFALSLVVAFGVARAGLLPIGVDSYYYLLRYFGGNIVAFSNAYAVALVLFVGAELFALAYYSRLSGRDLALAVIIMGIIIWGAGTASFRLLVFEPDDFAGSAMSALVVAAWLGLRKIYPDVDVAAVVALFLIATFVWAGAYLVALVALLAVLTDIAGMSGERWSWVLISTVALVVVAWGYGHTYAVSESSAVGVLYALWLVAPLTLWNGLDAVDRDIVIALVLVATVFPKFAQLALSVSAPIIAGTIVRAQRNGFATRNLLEMWVFVALLFFAIDLYGFGLYSQVQESVFATVLEGVHIAQQMKLPVINFWEYGYYVALAGGVPYATPDHFVGTYPHNARAVYIMPCHGEFSWDHYCQSKSWVVESLSWQSQIPRLSALFSSDALERVASYQTCAVVCQP